MQLLRHVRGIFRKGKMKWIVPYENSLLIKKPYLRINIKTFAYLAKSLNQQGFHPLGPKISIQYAYTIYCPSNEATWKQHGKHNELMLSQQNKLQPTF